MEVLKKVLTDAYVLKPNVYYDERGFFYESFNKKIFQKITGHDVNFVQDNKSRSSKGILRGFHYQNEPFSQNKLVNVVKGRAYDVAVDMRPLSKTYKNFFGIELTEENHLQFFIPKGFAHAFLALEDNTILEYKVDNQYSKEHESGFFWNDPELPVNWPLKEIFLSEKDKMLPPLNKLII